IDLATIEREKENILPLRSGRSVAALAPRFGTPDGGRAAVLETQRKRHEGAVAGAHELDDPLEVYYKYLRWTLDSYPQGNSNESNLVPLLERCTRTFRDDKRYTNDPRYLRCWLMYAEYSSDPPVIYQYLQANNIGQELAAFYEDYAMYEEKQSRWQRAERTYKLGINRLAQPLERLNRKFKAFKNRM
ncbi:Mad3/BUB1 homology region 1-domain-containing protein, partial [Syncephalis pseudoplumigaleata]